jgi:uncharacterized protein
MPARSLMVERDVEMAARDGVVLRSDVYRLAGDGQFPVLLQRTPYGKGFGSVSFALAAAERGYAVVIQDTRGRWASDGDGTPLIHEKADGYDAVEWAAAQPWANGSVGMFGGSYVGYTQLAAASQQPPSLKTIVPAITFCDPYALIYPSGVLALGVIVSWGLTAQAQMAVMRCTDPAERARLTAELVSAIDGMRSGTTFRHLPLETMPLLGRGEITSFLADMLDHADPEDPYWEQIRIPPASITVPAFHVGGWYDIFIQSTVSDFSAIRAAHGAEPFQKLLVGPWLHGALSGLVGEVDFGFAAYDAAVLTDEQQLRWFDTWLKGADNGILEEASVRYFTMGENRWREADTWPLQPAPEPVRFYLHSGGAANSLHGDGVLSFGPAEGGESVDSFVDDPRNPVPTCGGGLCCWNAALAGGAFDQRDIEARADVLVYTSAVLEEDLEITGWVRVRLWAATTAASVDFTAKLVDVGRCGFARNVADGIARAAEVTPHAVRAYTIEVGPTSNLFKAGHRVRLEISSSNFPKYERNPRNTVAVQTVYHDGEHGSVVEIEA